RDSAIHIRFCRTWRWMAVRENAPPLVARASAKTIRPDRKLSWRVHDEPLRIFAMPKKTKMLQDLFHDTLKDVYFAEKKILTTLPKMKKAAQSEELAAAFEKHHGETEGHVQRLEQVFKI